MDEKLAKLVISSSFSLLGKIVIKHKKCSEILIGTITKKKSHDMCVRNINMIIHSNEICLEQ